MTTHPAPSVLSSAIHGFCSAVYAAAAQCSFGQAVVWGGVSVAAISTGTVSSAVLPAVGSVVIGSVGLYCLANSSGHFAKAVIPWTFLAARGIKQVLVSTRLMSV